MSNTHMLKRSTVFVVTIMLATLTVMMMAQSANAEITTIAEARETLLASDFLIDTAGGGIGEYYLRFERIDPDGTFNGYYFRRTDGGLTSKPNVDGKITITVGAAERGRGTSTVTAIRFTANGASSGGIVVGGTVFDGAMRLLPAFDKTTARTFMAGTYTVIMASGSSIGPFPFIGTRSPKYR